MLRIAKHEPPAALADDELLRDITVGEGHRLGKPDAIPVREFARAVRKVRQATCAQLERIFMLGRAQQNEDRRGSFRLHCPPTYSQSWWIGSAHVLPPDPPAQPHVHISPPAALHLAPPTLL